MIIFGLHRVLSAAAALLGVARLLPILSAIMPNSISAVDPSGCHWSTYSCTIRRISGDVTTSEWVHESGLQLMVVSL